MIRLFTLTVALLLMSAASTFAQQPLFPNADFETGTLEGWTADGDAFARQPIRGDNPAARNRETSGHQGQFWIGTYEDFSGESGSPGSVRGDGPTGTLTSPLFTIRKPHITFLIGGGNLPGETGVKLLCDGQETILASGVDSETMVRTSADVSSLQGKTARLVVFDNATGGWGHINVDDFTATDEPAPGPSMEFALLDGISAQGYPDTGYDQPLRPQFHFSSRRNWLNDPNGMVHDGQQYFLFFQHNPNGTAWGNMTWGRATSPDMIHWTQHDHALLPYQVDGRSGTIFSGTAVVDHNNSLGKQVGDTKTLCAFFTFAGKPTFYQAMAYSTDSGRTWTYWNDGRPVVDNQGFDKEERDPKVFWHPESNQWVMVLWVQRDPGRVRFFTSPNLTDWSVASDLMRDWAFECMDVVFLPVDGEPGTTKCLIYDASFDYEIGTFDGKVFHSETGPLVMGGGNFYAAQSFNNPPDDRAVQIGWMRGGPNSAEAYGLPANQQMSFPYQMTLYRAPNGLRLRCWPIEEIDSLVTDTHQRKNLELTSGVDALQGIPELDLVDVSVDFDPGDAQQVVFDFPDLTLVYDTAARTLTHTGVKDDGTATTMVTMENLAPRDGSVQLRFLIDRLSVETFAFGGEDFRAHYFAPHTADNTQSIHAVGGTARINRLSVRQLKSAWPK